MAERKASFAQRLRNAAEEIGSGGAVMSVDDLLDAARVQTYEEKKRAWNTLRDLVRSGELERVDRGRYRLVKRADMAPKKQAVMWRFLKMRRVVTVDDLVEVSAASRDYVREWLRGLARKDVVRRREDGAFVLTQEMPAAEPPKNDAKAEKLRELRRERKARVMEALDRIHASVCDLCGTLEDLVASVKASGEDDP